MHRFRTEVPFEERKQMAERKRKQSPNHVPVILESRDIHLKRQKFMVHNDSTLVAFLTQVRSNLQLRHDEAIFAFLDNNTLVPHQTLFAELYQKHKSEDDLLYITISKESAFGSI